MLISSNLDGPNESICQSFLFHAVNEMCWLQIPVIITSLRIYYLLVSLAIKVLYFSYEPKWLAGYFNASELMTEAVILIVPIEYEFNHLALEQEI
jgi:hypothetical protein